MSSKKTKVFYCSYFISLNTNPQEMHPEERKSGCYLYLSSFREGDHHFVKRIFDLSFKRVISCF